MHSHIYPSTEHKKAAYRPLPFRLGSYKFTRVKKADEFVEELGKFHFGEINFHRNDSRNKVTENCKEENVHFEYTSHWDKDESIFRSAENITALRRRFKKKITTKGGKEKDEQKKVEEEESRKRDEDARRLAQKAESWLKGEEEEKIKAEQEAARKAEEDS